MSKKLLGYEWKADYSGTSTRHIAAEYFPENDCWEFPYFKDMLSIEKGKRSGRILLYIGTTKNNLPELIQNFEFEKELFFESNKHYKNNLTNKIKQIRG